MSRISHVSETLEYLRTIGVDSGETPQSRSSPSPQQKQPEGPGVSVLAFVAVLLGILLVCILAAAQPTDEVSPVEGVSPCNADAVRAGPLKEEDFLSSPLPLWAFSPDERNRSIASDIRREEPFNVWLEYADLESRVAHLEKVNWFALPLLAAVSVYVLASALPGLCLLLRGIVRRSLSMATFLGQRFHNDILLLMQRRLQKSGVSSCSVRGALGEKIEGCGDADFSERPAFPIGLPLPKEMGFQSITGPVRSKNEDACIAWSQGPYRIAVVADGLGGHPEGGTAAHLASLEAARTLSTAVGTGHFEINPQRCLAAAFRYASNTLYERAMVPGFRAKDGLRTTLITVVCTPSGYHYGYIGDGGLWVRRRSGDLEKLLSPHKADALHPNILAASLGPAVHGSPEFGEAERREGDLLFVGTDGVFDRIEDSFAEDVAGLAAQMFSGNLQEAVEETLRQLASAQDKAGYLCEDNMTLVLIADERDVPSAQTGSPVTQESVEPSNLSQEDTNGASTKLSSQ
ncbi:MAG: protein phosphatase 2C domain-containing protein [bacterium]|nr:protein phosphatase 2C domain-containing protein [bacterium]